MCHPSKKLLYDIEKYDLPLDNLFDLSLGSYLIEPELRDYSLKSIVSRFSPNKQELSYVASIIDTGEYIFELLKENNLFELYENIERPLVPILISMEKKWDKNRQKKSFQSFYRKLKVN